MTQDSRLATLSVENPGMEKPRIGESAGKPPRPRKNLSASVLLGAA
jgi:hypothetical protein